MVQQPKWYRDRAAACRRLAETLHQENEIGVFLTLAEAFDAGAAAAAAAERGDEPVPPSR